MSSPTARRRPPPTHPATSAVAARLAALSVLAILAHGCARAPAPAPRGLQTQRHDLTERLEEWIVADGAVDPGRPICAPLLGLGWYPTETAADGMTYAWTAADTARLTLPARTSAAGRLIVRACGLDDGRGPRRLTVVVNGRALGTQRLSAELGPVEFAAPAGVLRAGDNAVALVVDRCVRPIDIHASFDSRALGALVDFVRFLPAGAPEPAAWVDPYDEPGAFLDAGRALEGRPARLAGARLRLAWRGGDAREGGGGDGDGGSASDSAGNSAGDSLVVEVATERGAPPLLRAAWPAAGARATSSGAAGAARGTASGPAAAGGAVDLEMPPALPPKSLLSLRLAGRDGPPRGRATITTLELERSVRPVDVVLIVIDTLRPDHLGCYGDRRGLSPAIDALARDGIVFENAVATAPITGPSHASLMTSRWAGETGVVNNCVNTPSPALPMLAELLRDLDYDTRAVVSISPVHADFGFARGFAAFADELGAGTLAPGDTVVARAREQLDRSRRPLFLWAHFSEPHEPYDAHGLVKRTAEVRLGGRLVARVPTSTFTPTVLELELPPHPTDLLFTSRAAFHVRAVYLTGLDGPTPWLDPAEPPEESQVAYRAGVGAEGARRVRLDFSLADQVVNGQGLQERYAREVAACDSSVGVLLDELRRRGLYDEALIVFAADHSEALGEHGLIGHVENVYDDLIRVPLVVKPPRASGLKPGQSRRDLASLVDVLPTVLAQLGRPPLAGAHGRDLLDPTAARGGDDAVFAETHRPQAKRTLYALRGARHKIVHEPATGAWEFYDLRRDPGERRDLYRPGHALARRWQARLEALLAELRAGGAAGAADESVAPVIDEKARRALRALGY